jgi:hypothetical protein
MDASPAAKFMAFQSLSHTLSTHSLLVILREVLGSRSVHAGDDDMITFIGLE